VQKHDEVDGVYFVLGDLAEGTGESGTLQIDVKEAVDYATMDNLYSELYAMADVVGGAMRQENADADFRKTTILTTIDNFRAFAEVVLENLSAEKLAKAVDPKDHPDLVVDILHAIADAPIVDLTGEENEDDKADAKAKDEEESGEASETGANQLDFNEVVTQFNESLNNFGSKLIESITASTKELQASNTETLKVIESVAKSVEKINNTTLSVKAEKDEEEVNDTGRIAHKESGVFRGSFFRSMSDFNR
jgi:hypothetical protein